MSENTSILRQVQTGLLAPTTPLSDILRSARVLASQIKSSELRDWVLKELNGYNGGDTLPDYRVLRVGLYSNLTNGVRVYPNYQVVLMGMSTDSVEHFMTVRFTSGVKELQELAKKDDLVRQFSAEEVAFLNTHRKRVANDGYYYIAVWNPLSVANIEQIIDTVRNRLLEFVIEIDELWEVHQAIPSGDAVRQVFNVTIHSPEGGNVSVFDQRGQQVNYQYNAAGNINLSAVQTGLELAQEFEKLRDEIERAKQGNALSSDVAVEAEYHLLQASKEAKVAEPNRQSILDHVGKAKALLEDVAAAAGLVGALVKAAEVVSQVLK